MYYRLLEFCVFMYILLVCICNVIYVDNIRSNGYMGFCIDLLYVIVRLFRYKCYFRLVDVVEV